MMIDLLQKGGVPAAPSGTATDVYKRQAYVLLTRAPVATKVLLPRDAPRLACVKPPASVHPEPGSNSSL